MSTFREERLKRTDWDKVGTQALADELFAILHTVSTEGTAGPLKVGSNGVEAPITFEMPDLGQPPPGVQYVMGGTQYVINPVPGSYNPVTIPSVALPPLVPGSPPIVPPPYTPAGPVGGSLPPPYPPPPPYAPGSPPTVPPPPPGTGGGGNPFPDLDTSGGTDEGAPAANPPAMPFSATVIVRSGSGQDYVVDLWLSDPNTSPRWGRLPASAPMLDDEEVIPAGTELQGQCYYFSAGGRLGITVYLYPPVWAEEDA